MEIVGYPLFSLANIADRVVNRRFPAPGKIHANIKIFVFQHFETKLPECFDDRSIYVPIHAGSSMSDIDIPDALRDDTMPSISEFNIYLNEMTAIYWVGKHIADIGNPDYIGFAHYRRCLDWTPRLLKPGIVFASRFRLATSRESLKFSWDAIVPIPMPNHLPFGFHGMKAFDYLKGKIK